MTSAFTPPEVGLALPDHTQLPDSDATFVKNFQEHPQSVLLTDSILATLERIHPDGRFAIGQDSGIYWRFTDPPIRGAEAPDWFYVPDVPPTLNGQPRRSYVLWNEGVAPLIVLEFVSGDGSEERDTTPNTGKFWVYEQGIRVPFYGIYEVQRSQVEMFHLVENRYQRMVPNARGHYEIPQMQVEIGIWRGQYQNLELPWLRWWDLQGNLLLTGHEQAEQERLRTEQERLRAEQERQRADRLAEYLRSQGIDPDQIP